MNDFAEVIRATVELMTVPFYIWGFEFNFWQLFLFTGFAGIVAWVIGKIISGD